MLSDVIAALATPPGRSGVAVLRLSGTAAHVTAAHVLHPFDASSLRTTRRCRVVHPTTGEILDDALYVVYRGPASYTGEDVVEIFTHGGLLVPAEVLGAVLGAGARLATPGEFTRRAVLNGKIDLLQAEAIGDLVDATAPAQRRAALGQFDRGLSLRIDRLREQVLELETLVCYEIDFPEEDSGPIPSERVERAIHDLVSSFEILLANAAEGERLRSGALAVIAGLPNAGKSSLFNALVGSERAIVTEVPGTTRDAIEAPVSCNGYPVRLVDTAGLRSSGDRIEQLGIEVSHRFLDQADLILFCVDAGRPLESVEREFLAAAASPVVLVRTKADLTPDFVGGVEEVSVAATTGAGIAELRKTIADVAFANLVSQGRLEPIVTRARHRAALEKGLAEIRSFADARASGLEGAVAAVHLRAAVGALEDVIGVVTHEDVLDRVFGTFCIGK